MTIRLLILALFTAILAGAATSASAEVQEHSAQGFTLQLDRELPVAADSVFAALIRPADWWDGAHSWSGDAANMRFDARAGGCWCETLADGGSVEHGRILMFDPRNRTIVLESLLGPMQGMAQAGRMTWRVEPIPGEQPRARVTWTYRVGLFRSRLPRPDPVILPARASMAELVDEVLAQQFARLGALVTGAPMPAPPS